MSRLRLQSRHGNKRFASRAGSDFGGKMPEIEQSVGARDAIIAAFLKVFRRDGSREAEIAEVMAITGVSESAFYEHFQSKEELVSIFLKDRHAIWMRWFESEIERRYAATGGGLEIIADVLQEGFEDSKCLGLAFIRGVTVGGDFDHEPFAIAGEQKEHLGRFLEQLAVRMGLNIQIWQHLRLFLSSNKPSRVL